MAITLVGFNSATANAAQVTVTLPSFVVSDVAVLFWAVDDYGVVPTLAGWTTWRQDSLNHPDAGSDCSTGILYKLLNSGDTSPTIAFSGGTNIIDASLYVLRNVDPNTPLDTVIEYEVRNNDDWPNHPDLFTVTDNAALLVMRYFPGDAPTTRSLPSPVGTVILNTNARAFIDTGYILDSGIAGEKVMQEWETDGLDAGADCSVYTVALRQKSASNVPIYIGGTAYQRVFIGSTEIVAAYTGDTLTFGASGFIPPPTRLLADTTMTNVLTTSMVANIEFSEVCRMYSYVDTVNPPVALYSTEESFDHSLHMSPIINLQPDTTYYVQQEAEFQDTTREKGSVVTQATSAVAQAPAHGGPALTSTLAIPSDELGSAPAFNTPVTMNNGVKLRMFTQPSGFPSQYQNDWPVHQYGSNDAISPDNTVVNIQQCVVNYTTAAPGGYFPHAAASIFGANPAIPKQYGFAYQSAILTKCDPDGTNVETIRDLGPDGFVTPRIGDFEGNMSRDDRFIPVNDNNNFAIVDTVNGTISNKIPLCINFNYVTCSASGDYVVINQSNFADDPNFRREWVMDLNKTTMTISGGRLINPWDEHATQIQDANGDDWIVQVGYPITAIRLSDAAHVEFNVSSFGNVGKAAGLPSWFGFSQNANPGVIAFVKFEIDTSVSPFERTDSSLTDARNMFPVSSITYDVYSNIDTCWQILGLHRSTVTSNINACPRWDGNSILFSSNWNNTVSWRDFEYYI